jgi:hypothetical protein
MEQAHAAIGMEAGGKFYCCAHCAKEAGVTGLADRSAKPLIFLNAQTFIALVG